MFSKLFWSKQEECFICCSVDGKSDNEKQYELAYSQKCLNYPLVSLSNAYECNCHNSYAHNKCLININKCPTCRKIVIKPKLYVKTRYDYYLWFLLDWIKRDITRIETIKWCAIICMIATTLIIYLFSRYQKMINTIIPPKSNESLCVALTIFIVWMISLHILMLDDYFRKYWLYDFTMKRCYAF